MRYQDLEKDIKIFTPANCDSVNLSFNTIKMAKTVGDLAAEEPNEGDEIEGYVVQKDFSDPILLTQIDLEAYTNLNNTEIKQRQTVPYNLALGSLTDALKSVFEFVDIEEEEEENAVKKQHITVHREIRITQVFQCKLFFGEISVYFSIS
jgi:cleavage and polyadenylation specificity factor subunit 3